MKMFVNHAVKTAMDVKMQIVVQTVNLVTIKTIKMLVKHALKIAFIVTMSAVAIHVKIIII